MGETRVDLLHLLEDLRDAYAGALEETILTEIVANALDSGARTISVRTDPAQNALVVVDDGRGMTRRELSRYHDIAASSKTRGEGIGFAGVGIKLGLLACEEVLTETRKGAKQIATRWKLASRHRAPWRWVDAPGVVTRQGTGVCLRLRNPLSPLLDEGFLETTLRQHFESLLDARFDAALAEHYPGGVELRLNGRALEKARGDGAPFDVVLPRKRRPCAHGVLWRSSAPLPEDRRGVAVSTLGKVIRRGWDWLGLTPLTPDHVGGLIEAPVLAEALTLNKADFLRSGARGMLYLGVRKAIQQGVNGQLRAWGEGRDPEEEARRRAARPLERDLEAVLIDLAEDFPALAPLVERRAGGQTRLPGGGSARGAGAPAFDSASEREPGMEPAPASGESSLESAPSPTADSVAEQPETDQPSPLDGRAPLDGGSASRPQRYRLTIEFERREDLPDIGRLSQSTVFVNTAHAAYRRAVASRSEGYHVALSVAMALAPEVAEPAGARAFIAAFLESWGQALSRDKRRRGARS